ncbi:hypothetical protein D3C86_757990 [compost metagenome]
MLYEANTLVVQLIPCEALALNQSYPIFSSAPRLIILALLITIEAKPSEGSKRLRANKSVPFRSYISNTPLSRLLKRLISNPILVTAVFSQRIWSLGGLVTDALGTAVSVFVPVDAANTAGVVGSMFPVKPYEPRSLIKLINASSFKKLSFEAIHDAPTDHNGLPRYCSSPPKRSA